MLKHFTDLVSCKNNLISLEGNVYKVKRITPILLDGRSEIHLYETNKKKNVVISHHRFILKRKLDRSKKRIIFNRPVVVTVRTMTHYTDGKYQNEHYVVQSGIMTVLNVIEELSDLNNADYILHGEEINPPTHSSVHVFTNIDVKGNSRNVYFI